VKKYSLPGNLWGCKRKLLPVPLLLGKKFCNSLSGQRRPLI
jgi:hypothetical protein